MTDTDSHHASGAPIKISSEESIIPTNQAKAEQRMLDDELTTSDIERQKFELIRGASNIFRNTTYFGYGLMVILLLGSGIEALPFHLDPYVLVALVIGVTGSNIARIIKQLQQPIEYT